MYLNFMDEVPANWLKAARRYMSRCYTGDMDLVEYMTWYDRTACPDHVVLCFKAPGDLYMDCELVINRDDKRRVQFFSAICGLDVYYRDEAAKAEELNKFRQNIGEVL